MVKFIISNPKIQDSYKNPDSSNDTRLNIWNELFYKYNFASQTIKTLEMNTTTVNPSGKNSSKKNVATHAATATVAAGLGAVGAAMASEITDDPLEEVVEEVSTETSDQQNQAQHSQSNQTTGTVNTTTSNNEVTSSSTSATDAPSNEPAPITSTDNASEEVIEVVEEQPQEVTSPDDVEQNPTETVNPDDVAEAIIAEEQVDPNDIDMADVVNFDEIGTVYTVDGESYTAAAFHDAAGNQLVMVDVDGDDVFDVITDMGGNILTDPQGNILVAGDVTVDDVEIGITDSHTYLAANETDTTDEFGADSLMNDIIS